jgi:transposase
VSVRKEVESDESVVGGLILEGPPMWTCENRSKYNRDKLHYPSDLTDEEWSHVAPLIPPAKHGGRKRKVDVREVVNGIMYVLSTGCQWRYVPKDLPPKSTLFDYFDLWSYDGTLENIHHALYVKCREAMGQDRDGGVLVLSTLFGLYPFLTQTLRRWRLSRTAILQGPEESPAAPCDGDREKIGWRQRLRGLASAVGRRADLRMAQSLPPLGQGFRKSHS